jgi:hypothetical protein
MDRIPAVTKEKAARVYTPGVSPESMDGSISTGWASVFLILVLGFVAWVRVRLLAIPLERDEGEFAYIGQLILQGMPPYVRAYTMKLPGTHVGYALIMGALGQTIEAIHIGLLLVNAAAALLLFCLIRRHFGNLAGLGAGIAFALLSLTPPVLGTSAHATHFVLLPALGGLLLLVRPAQSVPARDLVLSGGLLGIAVLMKQPGLMFVALAAVVVMCDQHWNVRMRIRRALLLAVSAAIPYLVTCFVLWISGAFGRFWFWTAEYGWTYSSILTLSQGRQLLYSQFAVAARSGIWLWGLATVGVVILPLHTRRVQDRYFALAFLTFSFLAVCPGLYFRRHYWILLLPAIAMFAGIALGWIAQVTCHLTSRRLGLALPVGLFVAACAALIHSHSDFFFRLTPAEAGKALYGGNPFAEAPEIGKYLQEHTTHGDTVAVIGSEPEIYFYSRRMSATGYIYTYGMMEDQPYGLKMQIEMAREIEISRPKYLVFANLPLSWLVSAKSDLFIFSWLERYKSSHYRTVRVVSLAAAPGGTLSQRSHIETLKPAPSLPHEIEILERIGP